MSWVGKLGMHNSGVVHSKEEDQERENRINDCLFGTKKETRKSIGKCDRLDRETEFDRDDMMAVGTTEDFMVVRKKRKRYVIPDHERFPEKYVKYSFDEPVVIGGGESGREKKKRLLLKWDNYVPTPMHPLLLGTFPDGPAAQHCPCSTHQ